MSIFQADAGFDLSDATRAPLRDPKTLAQTDGFHDSLSALRDETIAFRRPLAADQEQIVPANRTAVLRRRGAR